MQDDAFALIVSPSRYFHNYRHTTNALLVYDQVRRHGSMRDDHIVLMLAGDMACDPRNVRRGDIFHEQSKRTDLYPHNVRPDYRGDEVSVESFLGVLTDRLPAGTPASRRLHMGRNSRLLLYLTGHGGNEFLKFHDQFELTAAELAATIRDTFALGRCKELLLLVDTCQAATLAAQLLPPPPAWWWSVAMDADEAVEHNTVRVSGLASSALGQSSYSHDTDGHIGVALSDRFTYHLHSFLARAPAGATLSQLEAHLQRSRLLSSPVRIDVGRENVTLRSQQAGSQRVRNFLERPRAALTASRPATSGGSLHTLARWVRASRGVPSAASLSAWRSLEANALRGALPYE